MIRIQKGSLRLQTRLMQASFWEYRFRVNEDGVRKLRAIRLGTVDELPTKAAAWAKARKLIPVNGNSAPKSSDSLIGDLIDRFVLEENIQEITAGRYAQSDGLKYSTAYAYLHILNHYIRPALGPRAHHGGTPCGNSGVAHAFAGSAPVEGQDQGVAASSL